MFKHRNCAVKEEVVARSIVTNFAMMMQLQQFCPDTHQLLSRVEDGSGSVQLFRTFSWLKLLSC